LIRRTSDSFAQEAYVRLVFDCAKAPGLIHRVAISLDAWLTLEIERPTTYG
jgi:hypothetical protein